MTALVSPHVMAARTGSTAPGGWRSPACEAMGYRFGVAVDAAAPELLVRLTAVLAPLAADGGADSGSATYVIRSLPGGDGSTRYSLSCGERTICERRSPALTARFLAWDVNRCAVDLARRDHTVLHAAAASRTGHTVVLAAPQEHGKTTMVAGLLAGGWDYVTDEAVAVRRDSLQITPFPKALSIDPGSWPLFPSARPAWPDAERDGQWQVPPVSLGAQRDTAPGRPSLLVLPGFQAGARTRLRTLHPAAAVVRLAQSTFGFPEGGAADLSVLVDLAKSCPAYEMTFGNLADGVRAVNDLTVAKVDDDPR